VISCNSDVIVDQLMEFQIWKDCVNTIVNRLMKFQISERRVNIFKILHVIAHVKPSFTSEMDKIN
jgi:hypothetical protein